jgi:Protein of unknown function (DUF998)
MTANAAAQEPATVPATEPASPRGPRTRFAMESEAVTAALIAGGATGLIAGIVFFGTTPTIWGGFSVGLAAAVAVLAVGITAGYVGYWRSRYLPEQSWRLDLPSWKFIVDATTVAVVHAAIATIATIATFLLLQQSFRGLVVDGYKATVAIGVASALAAYWIYLSVSRIDTRKMASLLVLFMAFGTITAMATAEDPQWWEYHFSQLGTFGDRSSGLFNITLIVAGALVTTFALYLNRDLGRLVELGTLRRASGPKIISRTFVGLGVMLAGVGAIPLTVSVTLHNICAAGMAVAFAVLLVASPFVLTGLPRRFTVMCAGFFATLLVSAVLFYPVGYFNLTSFELVAFVIIFGWIAVFIRLIGAIVEQADDELMSSKH